MIKYDSTALYFNSFLMNRILKTALMNSLATTLYIILVASFLFYAGNAKWGQQTPTIFIPILMLMLLVFSAALTGLAMLGRPVLWYLDGKKKEALLLIGYTLGIFFLTVLFLFGLMLVIKSR